MYRINIDGKVDNIEDSKRYFTKRMRFLFIAVLLVGTTNLGAAQSPIDSTDYTFNGHSYPVNGITADSEGYVYSASNDNTLKKIDSSGNEVWSVSYGYSVVSVAVDSDGYVYSGGRWDVGVRKIDSSGNEVWSFTNHSDEVAGLDVDSEGYVYSASNDGTVRKIDSSGNEVWSFDSGTSFRTVSVGNNGYVYAGTGWQGEGILYKLDSSGNKVWTYDASSGFVNGIDIDSEGNVYVAYGDNLVKKIDSSGNEVWSFTGHSGWVNSIAVDSEGYAYSASDDGTVKKISPDGIEFDSFSVDDDAAYSVGISPLSNSKQFLAVGTESTNNRVYRLTQEYNSPPILNNVRWNVSSPEYGDWVRFEANLTDPNEGDSVTEVLLKIQKNGTTLFNSNGTIEDGLWASPPINVNQSNVYYNATVLSATDKNGVTTTFSSGNKASFYIDNPPPQIFSAEVIDDRRNGDKSLELVLSDRGQNDIASYSGISNVRSFSNSSLIAGITDSSLDSEITVSDRAGLLSDPFAVNVSVSNSGLMENGSFAANLSSQRIIQELNITNQALDTGLNYVQKFEQVNGDNLTDTVVDGVVNPGTSLSNVAGWEGDWITGLDQRSFNKYQSVSYEHHEDAQRLVNQTELLADNEQPLEFTDVEISSVCNQTSSTNILPGDSVSATTDCNRPTFEVDYIDTAVGSESQDLSKASDLQTQYLQLQKNISETGGYSWSSVTIFPASVDGSCIDCSNRDRDIGAGQQISEVYHSSGDWISGETEDSYEKYASSGFDHSEEEQKLVNQTRLVVDNQRSNAFSEVNVSGQCSNAELVDIASGTDITATTNCSTPVFTVDFINQSISDILQDESYSHNLSSQGLAREKQLVETGGYNWSKVNVSALSMPGDCKNCVQRKLGVEANSTTSTFYNSTGDWVQEQVHNTTYSSGQVVYGGGIQQRFNATQQVYTNNTQSSVGFDVDFTEAVTTALPNCRMVNDTVQRISAGYSGDHSFVKSCNPGREISYTPVVKTDLGGKYEYNLTTKVEVFSELTSEQEHWIGIPQTRLDKWQDRNPSDTKAFVDGKSSEVRVEQGVVNGTEYVFVVVSDEFGDSSLHTGDHTATLIYTEGGDSSTDTGSPGQIGDPIEEVDGEDYSWDLYNVRSQEQEDVGFSIAGVPGREFERRLAVRNTGDQPVTLELECVSRGDACNWVNTSVDRIRLDTQDNTVSYFDVNGRVPMTAETEDVYRFSIRASDPSFHESTPSTSGSASADFVISISPFFGSVIEGIRDLLSWKEVEPPEWALPDAEPRSYPFAALPLIASATVYEFLRRLQRRYDMEVTNYDEIWKFAVAFLVFVVVTGLA